MLGRTAPHNKELSGPKCQWCWDWEVGVDSLQGMAYNKYCFMKSYFMLCMFVLSHNVQYISYCGSQTKAWISLQGIWSLGKTEKCWNRGFSLAFFKHTVLGAGELSDELSLPGTLWNLSSHDSIKMEIVDHALHALTDEVIIPHSGWEREPNEDCKPRHIEWESVLTNTAGCLR